MVSDDRPGTDAGSATAVPAPAGQPAAEQWDAPEGRGRATGMHRLVRLLGVIAAAGLILRGTQAVVALLTVLVSGLLRTESPAPGLTLHGLGELRPEPMTATTALVMIGICAAVAAMLLGRRGIAGPFAGIKAFALLAATALTGPFHSGTAGARVAVLLCGAALLVRLWPTVRDAAGRLLARAGLAHLGGRTADLALALKIAVLVGVVILSG